MEQTLKEAANAGRMPAWRRVSAGLVTGAADDDPSGIATYSQVGAAYGYNTMWSVLLALPLMIAIQMISARIGRVTGAGIAAGLRKRYGRWLAYGMVAALLVANIINLGADVGAMGAAMKLLVGGYAFPWTVGFVLLAIGLQVFLPFAYYAPILKTLTLSLFAYVATVFAIRVPWHDVLGGVFAPHIVVNAKYAMAIVAVLGTTISPYLFFWQAAQEVEEVRDTGNRRRPLKEAPAQGRDALQRIRLDTVTGMLVSEIVAFFIILTAAVVLHAQGKTDITTSAEAAAALRPLAGRFASVLFAAGIVGTGLLAVPILAGSAAYGVAEAFHEPSGLARRLSRAKLFYAVLIVAGVLGLALNVLPIDPVKALYWSAVINGVAAVPIMVAIMLFSMSLRDMGKFVLPPSLQVLGWVATLVMAAAAIVMFATWGR